MERQHLAPQEGQLRLLVEVNPMHTSEVERPGRANVDEPLLDVIGIDRIGQVAFEPEQHGLVGAVALARGTERAVQLDAQRAHLLEHAALAHARREAARGDHRTDGMRARGPDADLEEVEGADVHGVLTVRDKPGSARRAAPPGCAQQLRPARRRAGRARRTSIARYVRRPPRESRAS